MKIILVRHGKTEYPSNDEGQLLTYGPDAPLTPQGKLDIASLGRTLQQTGLEVSRIHASTYLRAYETAIILHPFLGARGLHLDRNLRDVDCPEYIGKVVGTTPEDYFAVNPWPESHETLEQLTARSVHTINSTISYYIDEETQLFVSHRDTLLSYMFHEMYGRNPWNMAELLSNRLDRGEAVVLRYEGRGPFEIEQYFALSEGVYSIRREVK